MSDHHERSETLTHYRRLSLSARLKECKSMVGWFAAIFVISGIGGFAGGLLGPSLATVAFMPFFVPFFLVLGLSIGSIGLFVARFADRKIFGTVKTTAMQLEEKIISASSVNPMQDLERLINCYIKLKRMAAADVYSKQLLEISKASPDEPVAIPDWVVTSECWVSTEKYHRGFMYRGVWLYETRGVLTLGPKMLQFNSSKIAFQCHPSHIVSIEVKKHPWWMKPMPLKFISITIDECGDQHTFNITPSMGQTDTIWDCNRMVELWIKRLTKVRNAISREDGLVEARTQFMAKLSSKLGFEPFAQTEESTAATENMEDRAAASEA